MTFAARVPLPAAAAALAALLVSCTDTPKSQKVNHSGTGAATDGSGAGDGSGSGDATGNGASGGNGSTGADASIDAAAAGDFAGWCKAAGATQVAAGALQPEFSQLCDGTTPRAFFATTLVASAYGGSGTPQLKYIQKVASDPAAETTTAYFGVGIKLPISIAQHFDTIGPKTGSKACQEQLAGTQGSVHQDALDISPHQVNDPTFVRGWRIHNKLHESIAIVTLTTETVTFSDQYQFKKGSTYLYAQTLDQGIETIKDYRLMTAGVQVNGAGYLLTVAHLVVDNKGLSSIAERKVVDTAAALVKAMYAAAADSSPDCSGAATDASTAN